MAQALPVRDRAAPLSGGRAHRGPSVRACCVNDNENMTSEHLATTGLEVVACGSGQALGAEETCFKELQEITGLMLAASYINPTHFI